MYYKAKVLIHLERAIRINSLHIRLHICEVQFFALVLFFNVDLIVLVEIAGYVICINKSVDNVHL